MLSTMNLPVRPSPQKTQKRQRSTSQVLSPSPLPFDDPTGRVDDIPFGGWSDSDSKSDLDVDDEAPPSVPSFKHIFTSSDELIVYSKDWAMS